MVISTNIIFIFCYVILISYVMPYINYMSDIWVKVLWNFHLEENVGLASGHGMNVNTKSLLVVRSGPQSLYWYFGVWY